MRTMKKREYNQIIKANKTAINNDFLEFIEKRNLTEYFKTHQYQGTFEENLKSDPWFHVTSLDDDLSLMTLEQKVMLDQSWKGLLFDKYLGDVFLG